MNHRSERGVDPTDPAFYDEDYYQAGLHDRHWFKDSDAKHRLRWETVLRLLDPHGDEVLLDLGCASGEHALELRPRVAEVIGVDFSPAAIRLAQARAKGTAGIRFMQADVADMSELQPHSVDKAVAIDLLEHITDLQLLAMLNETWRVLKPGGRLVFYTPCASHYVERLKAANLILKQLPGHIAVRDPGHYRRIFHELAWKDIDISFLPSSYPLVGRVDRALMRLPGIGPLFRFRIAGTLLKP